MIKVTHKEGDDHLTFESEPLPEDETTADSDNGDQPEEAGV